MLKLIMDCAPWLNWKIGAVFIGAVLCIGLVMGQQLGMLALLSATPLLGLLVCLIPCALPLLLFRRKARANTMPTVDQDTSIVLQSTNTCSCGRSTCSLGGKVASCKPGVGVQV